MFELKPLKSLPKDAVEITENKKRGKVKEFDYDTLFSGDWYGIPKEHWGQKTVRGGEGKKQAREIKDLIALLKSQAFNAKPVKNLEFKTSEKGDILYLKASVRDLKKDPIQPRKPRKGAA